MPTEENKAIFRKFVEEVMNQGNLPVVDELFAPEFVGHIGLPPVPLMSREGVKALFSMYHYAFSDFHATGANPAANACLTDPAFVAGRFRIIESRRPAPRTDDAAAVRSN